MHIFVHLEAVPTFTVTRRKIRYDTIKEFNVDSKNDFESYFKSNTTVYVTGNTLLTSIIEMGRMSDYTIWPK